MHTLCPDRAHNAVSWFTQRHVVVVPGSVAAHISRVAGYVARAHYRVVSPSFCIMTQIFSASNACRVACTGMPISTPSALCRDARPPSCHDTIVYIVTHLARQAARALPHALARGPAVSWAVMVVSQGCVDTTLPRCVVACHCAPSQALCHDTICWIMT